MERKLLARLTVPVWAACGCSGGSTATEAPAVPVTVTGTQTVVIEGFDWGPAVTKAILTLDQAVAPGSVTPEAFAVTESKESFNWAVLTDKSIDPTQHVTAVTPRAVTAAYVCDVHGSRVREASNTIALDLAYDPNTGSPYCFDPVIGMNAPCDPYALTITLTQGSGLTAEGGAAVSGLSIADSIDLGAAVTPQLKGVDLSGTFTGSDGRTLTYGSFAPAQDGEKHPLVIWLHGAGEGGVDPSIPLLGNKVTALYGEKFQSVMGGAYVLTPQTPRFWLVHNENGDWQDNPGTDSIYLTVLMELIASHVAQHEGIDPNRIYVGGCSNGGYMTMNLILSHPDFFAAAFPICEAYLDAGITDKQLEAIKDLPVWFVYAANDTIVPPRSCEIPTIARLRAIGADVHASVFEDVHDTTGLYTTEDGAPYQYPGHWSWLYFFNNQCEENGVNMWEWLAAQSK